MAFTDRLRHAWNAFNNKDPTNTKTLGMSYTSKPDRVRMRPGNERSIINAMYNRMAIDASSVAIKHVRVNENGSYLETIDDDLNKCLTVEANIDQTARNFIQDIVMSLFDEGCVAVVPVDTSINPNVSSSYQIQTMRTAKIMQWYPEYVRVRLYNDRTGNFEEITLRKAEVAIIENPLYSIMNEPNSILKRLIRKLNLLDAVDEQSGAGKLDLIIQLPYVIKTEARKQQAEQRRKDIEMQLAGSKYGIAYTDGTEHVTQLNRSVDNNLMTQIEYLMDQLYSQLGITAEILNGTADEQTMLNYQSRTIEPILSAITDEMRRKFLTKTARSQRQSIMFFSNPFKLVSVTNIAEISDTLTRNEILSTNEVRGILGYKPADDPRADELRNKNINQSGEEVQPISLDEQYEPAVDEWGNEIQNGI